jgi:predicted transposase YbfD/YdcC
VTLLVIIFLAKLAGKDKPDEIADWAKNHATELAEMLGLGSQQMPSHSTIRGVFHMILDEAQEQVAIAGKVITGDAIHTQRAISKRTVECGGHYLWLAKTNQPRLYEDIERLFAPDNPKPGFGKIATDFQIAIKFNYGHGGLEKRTIQTSSLLNDYLDWPGVGQVYLIERKFDWVRQVNIFKSSCEIEYGITSLPNVIASPAQVLLLRRQHWGVETGLHYRRDVTFREDATRMTIGAAGKILATVHNVVIGLIKRAGYDNAAKARRYFDGHIAEGFDLLLSVNCPS